MRRIAIALALAAVVLSGCATGIKGDRYRTYEPGLDLVEFFLGDVKAWGIVQDRSGNVIQRFQVDIEGTDDNGVLVLDETFTYGIGDGIKKRTWRITPDGDGGYSGEADDVPSGAVGKSYGNAVNLTYTFDLPVDDTTYKVNFNDWFWAFDKNTLMNRAYIRKFGVTFAEVTIFMQKAQ